MLHFGYMFSSWTACEITASGRNHVRYDLLQTVPLRLTLFLLFAEGGLKRYTTTMFSLPALIFFIHCGSGLGRAFWKGASRMHFFCCFCLFLCLRRMVLYLLRYDVTERCGEQWNSGVKGREVRTYRVTGLGSVAGRTSGRAEVMRRRAKGTRDAIESDGAIKLVCPLGDAM